jgi:metallo-beta-lactamase class B
MKPLLQSLLYSVPLFIAGAAGTVAAKELVADPTHRCDACTEWNLPLAPFRVYGNTWYVGTAGLGAILITSDKGHVLIDGGLPQSAPLIAANIRTAGFRLEDVQLILNSHTHYDHAGGIAALQRASGARVGASAAARRALEQGGPTEDDPQYAFGHEHNDYAAVKNVFAVGDGETLRVGSLAITPHYTPGHTPGGTTWTWESCEADRCLNLVYADSLNSVSAPAFKFSADPARVAQFEKSMSRVEGLACDILLAPHPVFIALEPKLAAWKANPSVNPFIGDDACRSYANGARQRLKQRLADEAKTR